MAVSWAAGLLLAPTLANAQQLGGGGDVGISWIRVILALAICLAVAAFAIWFLRQRSHPGGMIERLRSRLVAKGRIRTIESRRISPHADLCLVHCDGVEYLLICTAGNVELLERRELAEEASE